MTSTIILYKDCQIVPARNFVVEDIETYLSGLTKITILDFQYLRNDLKLTIKINKSQDYADAINTYNYNYLKVIQNSITYYYFISKKTQVAQNTIALEMTMDTANTFKWNTAFKPTNKTRVIREHKDRVKRYVSMITFEHLELGTYNIYTPFPNDPFSAYLEIEASESLSFNATAQCNNDGNITLTLASISIKDGLDLVNELNNISRIHIYSSDLSISYAVFYFDEEGIITTPQYSLLRNIDYLSEGINPVLYKEELGILDDSGGLEWNLIYRNHADIEDTPVALDCFCVPSGECSLNIPAQETYTYTDFVEGKYYTFLPWSNVYYEVVDNDNASWRVQYNGSLYGFILYRSGTTLKIRYVQYTGEVYNVEQLRIWGGYRQLGSEKVITSIKLTSVVPAFYIVSNSILNESGINLYTPTDLLSSTISSTYALDTLDKVDRADPKLTKIITIPYFPSPHTMSEGKISIDETFVYEGDVYHSLKLNNLNTNFLSSIVSSVLNPLNIFDLGTTTPNTSANRNSEDYFESKLFHSEFYQPKFVYDSFGFIFELEKIAENSFTPSVYFTFEFVMTSTINSKFMFKFPEYVLKLSTQDFDNILPVARNNEATIYNSAYATYLMSAYRYDLKFYEQKQMTTDYGYFSSGMKDILSLVGGVMGKNPSALAEGGNFFMNTTDNVINTFSQTYLNKLNLEAKIEALKQQSVSVYGSDDLDLMKNYCGNKAKLCLYKPSDRMVKLISDLFYYFGYRTDEIKIPAINTRYWFNYLECELIITGVDYNMTESIKDDIKARYQAGITFLHNHSGNWDFDQVKENWETSIL